jgi:integrase/recombinase XerD
VIVCKFVCKFLKGRISENEILSVMLTTVSIILDTRRMKKKTKTYPVKLQVTFKRATKHYQTIFALSEANYEKLSASRIGIDLQKIRDKLKHLQRTAELFIEDLEDFSFYLFERDFIINNDLFKQRKKLKEPENVSNNDDFDFTPYYKRFTIFQEDHSNPCTISIVYLDCIKNLIKEGRIGTALAYKDSFNSIKRFKGNVAFKDITVSFLYQYEQWMLNKGRSRTTVGIKLRNLRAIFNEAAEMGIIKKDKCYPFGRRKYQIPTGRNIKKALDQNTIGRIYFYEPDSPALKKAKDFWLFCYFGNGMNPKDVVHLKWKNIQDGYIIFTRAKTERTTRTDPRQITVYITEDMQRIIENYGSKDRIPDNCVFPIMNKTLNPLQQYELVPLFTKFINEGMKSIINILGLDKKVTTIVSRHSFSTQLKRSGASTEFIQEALGHTDKKTTENYLDSFDKELKKEFAGKLALFKNEIGI